QMGQVPDYLSGGGTVPASSSRELGKSTAICLTLPGPRVLMRVTLQLSAGHQYTTAPLKETRHVLPFVTTQGPRAPAALSQHPAGGFGRSTAAGRYSVRSGRGLAVASTGQCLRGPGDCGAWEIGRRGQRRLERRAGLGCDVAAADATREPPGGSHIHTCLSK